MRALGAASAYGRDRRLFHHVRGLPLAARGDTAAAASELRGSLEASNLYVSRTELHEWRAWDALGARDSAAADAGLGGRVAAARARVAALR